MKIPVVHEANKLAAAKAAGITAFIPIAIVASVIGLFINAEIVGYAWLALIVLAAGGFVVFVIAVLLCLAIANLYLTLYSKFSGEPKREW